MNLQHYTGLKKTPVIPFTRFAALMFKYFVKAYLCLQTGGPKA